MRLLTTILMLILVCSCSPSSQKSANQEHIQDRAPVDRAIDEAVARGAFPFLYVRVERLDGKLLYEHSSINSEFTSETPDADRWLRLWSMSKSVTIATILSLEEEGILDRADPVTEYIPEFADLMVLSANATASSCDIDLREPRRSITIEDLLNHNDGFYYPFTGYECLDQSMREARIPEATSSEDLIRRLADLPLHPDGIGEHQYGIGTTILGLVAERATGKKFDAIVEEQITGPLGVADTLRYTLPEGTSTYPRLTGKGGTLRLAQENELDILGGPVPLYSPETSIFLGGEGMVGTTRSFARFLRLMGNLGELDGTRVLDQSTVKDWYSPKTQLDNPYGHNGFNIWVTSGKFDGLPNQKPGLLVGGGYEGTAFWIDLESGYVGLIMSQVHEPATAGVDEISRIRGLIYTHILEPGITY